MVAKKNNPAQSAIPAQEISRDPIQMVDLKNQYLKNKRAVDDAIQACIDSSAFIKGTPVEAFERQLATYLNVAQVVSCANGTDALQLALLSLELQPGDEVIVPAFNYIAAAEAVALLKLVPVLVDVDPQTFTLNAPAVAKALTSRTKAVIPVHLFGQCADMAPLLQLCQPLGIAVIEDTAQAIGAVYTYPDGQMGGAGTLGEVGTTSFFPTKNLGCFGDGGALYTNNSALARRVTMLANHGQEKKYYHDLIGMNSRLDALQAAVLTEKLKLLPHYTGARQWAAGLYDERLANVPAVRVPYRAPWSTHVFNQYTLTVAAGHRDGLQQHLGQHQIPTMIYYPLPVSQQKAYGPISRVAGPLRITEELCGRVLSLPMHTELSVQEIDYITDCIRNYFS